MTARRVYHVCESVTGAMGAMGQVRRLSGAYRTEQAAQRRKPRNKGRSVFFIEWEWVG